MSYDWFDLNRTDIWEFSMVAPQALDQSYGLLDGVLLDTVEITAGYYTDSRTSASLSFVGLDSYIPYSFIRIIHKIPEWSYEKEIGTYIVKSKPSSFKNGEWRTKLTLGSQLDKVAMRHGAEPWTLSSGARVVRAIEEMMNKCAFAWVNNSMKDYQIKETYVYETGSTFLERFYDLCSISDNRLDVNGHGELVIEPYISPKSKPAMYRLDLEDPHGIILGDVDFESDYLNTPNRCIVAYRFTYEENNETYEAEMRAMADITSGAHTIAALGYVISDFYEISDSENITYQTIQNTARTRLALLQEELIEWTITCKYIPVWEGDIIALNIPSAPDGYNGVRQCLVKNVNIHPSNMTIDLTLKDLAGREYED